MKVTINRNEKKAISPLFLLIRLTFRMVLAEGRCVHPEEASGDFFDSFMAGFSQSSVQDIIDCTPSTFAGRLYVNGSVFSTKYRLATAVPSSLKEKLKSHSHFFNKIDICRPFPQFTLKKKLKFADSSAMILPSKNRVGQMRLSKPQKARMPTIRGREPIHLQ